MTAKIINGAHVARRVHIEVAERVEKFLHRTGKVPGLATVLVGDDPASGVYVARKRKLAAEVGIADLHRHLPANATESAIAATLDELGGDDTVSGILLQLPLPGRMDSGPLIERIP